MAVRDSRDNIGGPLIIFLSYHYYGLGGVLLKHLVPLPPDYLGSRVLGVFKGSGLVSYKFRT